MYPGGVVVLLHAISKSSSLSSYARKFLANTARPRAPARVRTGDTRMSKRCALLDLCESPPREVTYGALVRATARLAERICCDAPASSPVVIAVLAGQGRFALERSGLLQFLHGQLKLLAQKQRLGLDEACAPTWE